MCKIVFGVMITMLLSLTVFNGYAAYEKMLLYHYKVVTPGVLYRSGILSYNGLLGAHRLSRFRSIVDLSAGSDVVTKDVKWYQDEKRFSKSHNVHLYNLYLAPGVKPNQKQIKNFLDIMADKNNLPVLVHCSQGVMRTNMMVAVYKMNFLRQSNQQVFRGLPMFGHDWRRHPVEKGFILTYRA